MTTLQAQNGSAKVVILAKGLKFFCTYIGVAIFVSCSIGIILKLSGQQLLEGNAFYYCSKEHVFRGMLYVACIGPLLEELMFRLWLSFKKISLSISAFVLCYLFLTLILKHDELLYIPLIKNGIEGIQESAYFIGYTVKLPIAFVCAVLVYTLPESFLNVLKNTYALELL